MKENGINKSVAEGIVKNINKEMVTSAELAVTDHLDEKRIFQAARFIEAEREHRNSQNIEKFQEKLEALNIFGETAATIKCPNNFEIMYIRSAQQEESYCYDQNHSFIVQAKVLNYDYTVINYLFHENGNAEKSVFVKSKEIYALTGYKKYAEFFTHKKNEDAQLYKTGVKTLYYFPNSEILTVNSIYIKDKKRNPFPYIVEKIEYYSNGKVKYREDYLVKQNKKKEWYSKLTSRKWYTKKGKLIKKM